jgi:DNA-binding CsgD family transcriptional regulator
MSESILQLASKGILPDDEDFLHAIHQISSLPNTFTAISSPLHRKIYFASPSIYELTGYPSQRFVDEGYEFLFSITAPESIPQLLEKIRTSFAKSEEKDFDPRVPSVYEFINDFIRPDATRITVLTFTIVIGYTTDGIPETIISIIFPDSAELYAPYKALLQRLKEQHNQLVQHPAFQRKEETLKKVFVLKSENQKLTPRELEVLKLLAKGFTSAEIADKLFIGENTVETHRRNLLSKFEAKNMAELIKKASKVYWLE